MTIELSISDLFSPASSSSWFQRLLDNASTLGLNATAWQSGSVARQILIIFSYALQFADVSVSGISQGGFLDFAASGSVTYTDAQGVTTTVPVTPEGGPGWLDILADGRYNVQRIPLTSAGGAQAFTNTSATTYGPFVAGTLHVSDPNNKQAYSSTADVASIPPSPVVGTSVAGVTSYFGQVQVTTSAAHGLSSGDVVTIAGALGVPPIAGSFSGYVTVLSTNTFVFDGLLFSGAYTGGATCYRPTLVTVTADVPGAVGSSVDATGAVATNTVTTLVTTLLGVSTANVDPFLGSDVEKNAALAARCRLQLQSRSTGGPKGAYEFYALSAVQFAAKLNPPEKLGAAVTRVRSLPYPSDGTVYVFVANPAGPSSPGDVGVVDDVIQAFACPEAVTAEVAAATEADVAVAVTAWLPAAYVSTATRVLIQSAIQAYVASLPIGGVSDPQGSYANIMPLEGIAGAIFDAAQDARIPIQNVAVKLNGAVADLQLVVDVATLRADVAVLTPSVPTVTLVAA